MTNQNCTRRTKKESSLFFCDLNFDQNKNKKKVPSLSRRSFLSLVMSLLFSLMLLGKARIKRRRRQSVVVVRKKKVVGGLSLPGRRFPFVRRQILLQRRTNHFIPVVVVIQRRRRRRVVPFCSVPFLTDRTQKNGRRRRDPRENLIISWKNARRFLPALTVVSLSRSIHQRRSLKNTLGSLRTEEEEGE